MTWLELIDELRKQPLHLLEHEVEVWNHIDNNGTVTNLIGHGELFAQEDDCCTDEEWNPDGVCRLSIESFHDVPDSFFTEKKDHDSTYKPRLNEYMVSVHRVCNVSVMAENEEQAQRIGRNLAGGYTSLACDTINEVILNCNDEFAGIVPNDRYCDVSLDAEDSMKVLNEEE